MQVVVGRDEGSRTMAWSTERARAREVKSEMKGDHTGCSAEPRFVSERSSHGRRCRACVKGRNWERWIECLVWLVCEDG